jgi:hypothetical protein
MIANMKSEVSRLVRDAIRKLQYSGHDVRTAIPPIWFKDRNEQIIAVVDGAPCTANELTFLAEQ